MDPQFQQATLRIEQPADPIMDGIPAAWVRTDEWYSFAASPRASDLRVLATIDENTYRPGSFFSKELAMGPDHPMVWKHCVGRGRVFYAAPGHTAETYAEPPYRAMLERALDWVVDVICCTSWSRRSVPRRCRVRRPCARSQGRSRTRRHRAPCSTPPSGNWSTCSPK